MKRGVQIDRNKIKTRKRRKIESQRGKRIDGVKQLLERVIKRRDKREVQRENRIDGVTIVRESDKEKRQNRVAS